MLKQLLWASLLAGGTICLAACDEKLTTLAGPTPNLVPTFSSIQRDIFETTDSSGRTACTNCHTTIGRATPAGGVNLTHDVAYDQIVNVAARGKTGVIRVIPGDPDNDSELARARISGPAFYLLRPDGHVGLAGTRFDAEAVNAYLAERQMRLDGKARNG